MCLDPASMAVIGGAVLSGAGTLYAGQAAKAEGRMNQKIMEENARQERQAGQMQADMIEDKYDRLRATQRASAAASGVNPAAGSAALVIAETSRNEFLDTMSTVWNAESSATNMENKGRAYKAAGKNAATGSYFDAAGSFLTGLGKMPGRTPSSRIA